MKSRFRINLVFLCAALSANQIQSAVIVNGSLNGQSAVIVNGSLNGSALKHSQIPSGWSNVSQGTSDTVSVDGHPFSSFEGIGSIPYPASTDGGTFVYSADFSGYSPNQPEGLRQDVTGFIGGMSYSVSFEFTNLGLYDDFGMIATNAFGLTGRSYDSSGRWLIFVDGVMVGVTPTINAFEVAGTQQWFGYEQTFTPSSTDARLEFVADWVSGSGSHVGMGIDGVRIQPVPEPEAVGLFGVTVFFGLVMRRRQRSHMAGANKAWDATRQSGLIHTGSRSLIRIGPK